MPTLDLSSRNDSSELLDALFELRQELSREDIDDKIKKKTNRLIEEVSILQASGADKKSLKNIVLATKNLLTGHESPQKYQARAAHVQGAPSLGMKILGGLMMALGAAFIIVLAVGALPATSVLTGVVTLSLCAGIGLFADGCRSGLSKSITNLSEAKTHSI